MSTTQATNKVTSQQHVNAIKFVNGIRHALDAFQYDNMIPYEQFCEQTSQTINTYLDTLSTKKGERTFDVLSTMQDILNNLIQTTDEDTTEDTIEDTIEDTTT